MRRNTHSVKHESLTQSGHPLLHQLESLNLVLTSNLKINLRSADTSVKWAVDLDSNIKPFCMKT